MHKVKADFAVQTKDGIVQKFDSRLVYSRKTPKIRDFSVKSRIFGVLF